jgi:hypothetical protein
MSSNNGPIRNTYATSAHAAQQARVPQNVSPHEETHLPELSEVPACPSSTASRKESILTSIAEQPGDELIQPEEGSVVEENTPSKHETIREILEDVYEPEQSYMMAPSQGPSADPAGLPLPGSPSGRISSSNTSTWSRRGSPPHLTQDNEWVQFKKSINLWNDLAQKNKQDVVKQSMEASNLQT